MALAGHAAPPRHPYYDRGCAFGRWIDTLAPPERSAVLSWLPLNSGWAHSGIGAAIRSDTDYPGVDFADPTIARHRRGLCTCGPR